jgi:hypothetical protein
MSWVAAVDERLDDRATALHKAEERRFGEAELIPESDAKR